MKMSNERLTKKVFLWDKAQYGNNWSYDMKNLFETLDSEEIFLNSELCDIAEVKLKIKNLNNELWENEILSKPKLRTYRLFKNEYEPEPYLLSYLPKYDRSLLCQFRTGILPLNIETGRFKNVKDPITGHMRKLTIQERVCDMCQLNEVEDEFHFLCRCTAYNDRRQLLFQIIEMKHELFSDLPLWEKFIFVMRNCNVELSKYIKYCWNVRKDQITIIFILNLNIFFFFLDYISSKILNSNI